MVGLPQEDLWQHEVVKREKSVFALFHFLKMTVTINMRGHSSL
jgi:hypothetical protein